MYATTQPSKESVREYLKQRLRERTPLPTQSEIRQRLGWGLVTCPARIRSGEPARKNESEQISRSVRPAKQ